MEFWHIGPQHSIIFILLYVSQVLLELSKLHVPSSMWYTYTMEYYSAIKNNEMMPSAAKWMNLECLILSEVKRRRNIV